MFKKMSLDQKLNNFYRYGMLVIAYSIYETLFHKFGGVAHPKIVNKHLKPVFDIFKEELGLEDFNSGE